MLNIRFVNWENWCKARFIPTETTFFSEIDIMFGQTSKISIDFRPNLLNAI